jgi:ferredoxin-nitrate reductase
MTYLGGEIVKSESKNATCAYCGVGCQFEIEEKILPVEKGSICSKGASQLKSIDQNRLLYPMYRENISEDFTRVSWDFAIEKVVEKIGETAPEKMGFYLSGQLLTEDYYIANKLAKGFLKTANVDTNSRTCMASAVVGYKKSIGLDYVPTTSEDALGSDLYILVGSNLSVAHSVLFKKVKKELKRGLKLIVIDPRKTEVAKLANLHIQIEAGKDIFLLNAIAKELAKAPNPNVKLNGWEEYLEQIAKVNREENLKNSGVSEKDFQKFLELWNSSENIVSSWTMGLNQSSQGVKNNLSLINLHLLSGKIFKPFNGAFSLTGQPNAMGGREVGGLATTLAVHLDFTPENVENVEKFWKTNGMPQKNGLTAYEMIRDGSLEFLFVSHTDPVFHLPNRNLVEEKFREIDFVIDANAYLGSETSKFAHLLLPASPFGEKSGVSTNYDRVVSKTEQLFQKSGESLQDWEIFAKVGEAMEFDGFNFANSDEVYKEYREMTKLSPDIDLWRDKSFPFRWGEEQRFTEANILFQEWENLSEEASDEFPLLLLTGRYSNHWHSNSKTVVAFGDRFSFVEISREDLEKLGVKDGEKIRVISRRGEVEVFAKESGDIERGTLFIPMHFREINRVTSDILDPFSKEPDYNHSAVRVEKI